MTKTKMKVIRTSSIANNCPECFNQDMTITFFQKHRIGKLFHRITGEVVPEVKCNTCGSTIYPVNWTPDIERSYEYNKKLAVPQGKALRFTALFYILILLLIALVAIGVYGLLQV